MKKKIVYAESYKNLGENMDKTRSFYLTIVKGFFWPKHLVYSFCEIIIEGFLPFIFFPLCLLLSSYIENNSSLFTSKRAFFLQPPGTIKKKTRLNNTLHLLPKVKHKHGYFST